MKSLISALVLVASSFVAGQRPSFAGLSPIGYPPTPNRTTTTPDPLGDRFGEAEVLPIEANGDRDLIDRLSKLPIDKQPFWFINWQAYEQHRKDPQTFPQRPSSFNVNNGQAQGNTGFAAPNPGVATEPNVIFNRFASTTTSSQSGGNFNNNPIVNNGGNVRPPTIAKPISHINPSTNVYDNSNVHISSNSNSNVYPNINSNTDAFPDRSSNFDALPDRSSNFDALPDRNSNWYNGNPAGNVNPNNYPAGNVNPNNYPAGNVNPNYYPAGNVNPNNYPAGNVNPNYYPAGYVNPNNYPAGNVNPNNYPAGNVNPNSNEYQTSSFNSNSNTGTVNKNGASIQTTQKYQWTMSYKTTQVGSTNSKNRSENNPRTDTYHERNPYYN